MSVDSPRPPRASRPARPGGGSEGEAPALSVVVPLFDEEENVGPLVSAVRRALEAGPPWELILVDDGSEDATAERAREEVAADGRVRLLRLARNYGQTTAMQAGFDDVRGEVVVTMDGDLQNDPRDIPRLLDRIESGYDLVAGYREDRKDPWLTRRLPSWAANHIIRLITGVDIRDNGCSLKAYRRDLVRNLSLYAELHRFVPAVAAATASVRIAEVPVRHHPRVRGESKYGLSRLWKVLVDLLAVTMIRWFRERPLTMFGLAALPALALGGLFGIRAALAYAAGQGLDFVVYPGVILLWVSLAGYLLVLGLIAEVVLRRRRSASPDRLVHMAGDDS